MIVRTVDGIEAELIGEVSVNGKKMWIIDPGTGRFIAGVFCRYLICPPNTFHRELTDTAEVVA